MNKNIFVALGVFVGILMILLVVVMLVGKEQKPKTKPLVYPSEVFTLTWWNLYDDEDVYKEVIDQYKQEHPNANIKYVKKDEATYEEDLLNALAAGKGPDIFTLKNDEVFAHLDKLYPAPEQSNFYFIKPEKNAPKKDLKTQFQELFVEAASQDLVYENQVFGVPLYVDSLALYYNPKLFEEAQQEISANYSQLISHTENETEQERLRTELRRISNLLSAPPKTWDDFVEVVKLMTKKDAQGNIVRAAVAMGTAQNVNKATDILSLLLMQNNTQMVSEDKRSCSFHLPIKKQDGSSVYPGVAALDFYTSYARPDKETYTWNSNFPDSVTAFAEGKVAMIFGYSYLTPYLKRKYGNFHFEIAPMPQIKGIMDRLDFASYYPLVVAKNTPYPLAAWSFLKFLAEQNGLFSDVSKPLALREAAKAQYKQSQTAYLEDAYGQNVFNAQSYTARDWYKAGQTKKISEIFNMMIDNVVAKKQTPQEAMNAAAVSCTNILNDAEPLIERK